jgi:6-phosphogluconolactonase
MRVVVHSTPEATADAVAQRIAEAIDTTGHQFTLGLSGGSTPIPTYRRLRKMARGWDRVDAWVSDERWVPPDHERSNGRMAVDALIGHVPARLHRPPWGEDLDPAEAAMEYETVIRSIHLDHRPDLIHLGMGDDGHTASLFPGTAALEEADRWIVANPVPAMGETRITATYPLLWAARLIVVQVDGEKKAEAVRGSLAGETPAGRLVEGDAEVEWHLDEAAAALIS